MRDPAQKGQERLRPVREAAPETDGRGVRHIAHGHRDITQSKAEMKPLKDSEIFLVLVYVGARTWFKTVTGLWLFQTVKKIQAKKVMARP